MVPSDCGTDPARWEGIIPFRTLNIPVDWIRDSAGYYITYAISPAFSQDVIRADLPVHSRCRTADWFMAEEIYDKTVKDPKSGNPPKTFCCQNRKERPGSAAPAPCPAPIW